MSSVVAAAAITVSHASAPAVQALSGEDRPEEASGGPRIVYTLTEDAHRWDPEIKRRIIEAMDYAVDLYNALGAFEKEITVRYDPATPTADGNFNGRINFGGQISPRTALHEVAHTLGVGTHRRWLRLSEDGRWTGKHALELLRELDGPKAVLNVDRHHFWPYGLNFEYESSKENDRRHVLIVGALVRDMGLGPETPQSAAPSQAAASTGTEE